MESATTLTVRNPLSKVIPNEHPFVEELEKIRVALRGPKGSSLSELAASTMRAADREAAYYEWLCQEFRLRSCSPPPLAGCIEMMQELLVIRSISNVEFDNEIDGCIDVRVGTISIGWIGVEEGTYTPMFRDLQRFQERTWDHPTNPTLEDAKAWIIEQWEETKQGLLG